MNPADASSAASESDMRRTVNASCESTPSIMSPRRYNTGFSNQASLRGSYCINPAGSACRSALIEASLSCHTDVGRVSSSAVGPLIRSRIFSPSANGSTTFWNCCHGLAVVAASEPKQSIVNSSAPCRLHQSTSRQVSSIEKSLGVRYRLTTMAQISVSDPPAVT
jgi:hypothetical protein